MFRFVSTTLALGAAALVALLPATSQADTVGFSTRLLPAMWQRSWAPLLRLDRVSKLVSLSIETPRPRRSVTAVHPTARILPLAIDPAAATWWTRPTSSTPLSLELGDLASITQEPQTSDAPSLMSVPYAVPALLRYSNEDTKVALSISPGSPCTGACLKLEGSF
ncbi:MAG TPA: hypothetical protein VEQ59_09025 [Polyangiaceae bacterium]|nr:hypothetical protein [Polyangiaceae bacterium]